jgi:mannose-1-phosphate guanylyltransferase/mannose-1-phosphate guanylyltransferase/mannose-6-phosphate isomerase
MPETRAKIFPILLAGGSGTRLWPVSRELYPKQLVKFIGQDSLVQTTIKRLLPVLSPQRVRIVCGEEHFHEIGRHMEAIGIPSSGKVIREPCGRNTAPAILLAVLDILKSEEDAIMCVFPADHVIADLKSFHEKLEAAVALADAGYIVTFGIKPNYPETGYGYIEGDRELNHGAFSLKRFVEKPDRETAKKYLTAGTFFWNAGMFAFKASVMINEFQRFQADLYYELSALMASGANLTKENYGQLQNISIDYAIMENTAKGAVLPADFGWSDIGSWKSLYDFLPKDENRNVVDGDVIVKETKNCFIMGHERLIATNRIENMVVVETPDSVFVSDIENSRDVKSIVTELKESGREEYRHHKTIHHAWGSMTVLEHKKGYRVDRLVVYPGLTYKDGSDGCIFRHLMMMDGETAIFSKGQERILAPGDAAAFNDGEDCYIKNQGDRPATLVRLRIGIHTQMSQPKRKKEKE